MIQRYPRSLARVPISVPAPLHQTRVNQGELDGERFALLPACTLTLGNRVTGAAKPRLLCEAIGEKRQKTAGCDDLCFRSNTHLKVLPDQTREKIEKKKKQHRIWIRKPGFRSRTQSNANPASRAIIRSTMTVHDDPFRHPSFNPDKLCLKQSSPPLFSPRTLVNSPLNVSG